MGRIKAHSHAKGNARAAYVTRKSNNKGRSDTLTKERVRLIASKCWRPFTLLVYNGLFALYVITTDWGTWGSLLYIYWLILPLAITPLSTFLLYRKYKERGLITLASTIFTIILLYNVGVYNFR